MEAGRRLVRYLRDRGVEAYGFDEGGYVDPARARGIQHLTLSELAEQKGSFNVIRLIKVLEHIPDPVSLLQTVQQLLCPEDYCFSRPETLILTAVLSLREDMWCLRLVYRMLHRKVLGKPSHDEGLVKESHHGDIETSPVASVSKVQAHLRDAARFRARSTSHAVAARSSCTKIPLSAGRAQEDENQSRKRHFRPRLATVRLRGSARTDRS